MQVKKGEILQRAGDSSTMVYLVESGLLRSYSIDDTGKEHIFMFAPQNWIMGDGVPPERPGLLFIDALEDSVLSVIDKKEESLRDPAKLIRRVEVLQNRVIKLMSASAKERYLEFLETYPDIAQRVPQKMIASYLGVTPEALSRVRKDLSLGR